MKNVLFIVFAILFTSCSAKYSTEVGLTSTTYNKKFTKNTANNYSYRFDTDNISYTDRNGALVDLTEEQKQQIVENVNQCLSDAGYSNQSKDETKNILLNLQFKEKTTEDEELFYGQAMAEKYPNYNYSLYEEQGVGPQNRSVIPYGLTYASDLLLQNRHTFSNKNYSETLFNYVSPDRIYYILYPHYSKYAGLEFDKNKINTNCKRRYTPTYDTITDMKIIPFACYAGTGNLSNFYATLSGNIEQNKQFETTLHYKTNFIKKEADIEAKRADVVDFLSKNICLFITDNVEDLGINFVSTEQNIWHLSLNFQEHQIVKNKSNNAVGNYYTIKNKITGESFTNTKRSGVFKGNLYQPDGIYIAMGCPIDVSKRKVWLSSNSSVSIVYKSECHQDLRVSKMNVSADDIEVKNNLRKDDK